MKTKPNDLIHSFDGTDMQNVNGLTKREYFAVLAMQGNMSNPELIGMKLPQMVEMSIEAADALIKELNKETNNESKS